jgi:predicted aspartyl protease
MPAGHKTQALWDTGATGSVISPSVAKALALTPSGTVKVTHAGGSSMSPTYVVNLWLPNNTGVSGVIVTEFPGHGCDVLIGMDIMRHGDLSLTHYKGNTCMSFRMPSCAEVDFVKDHNRQVFAGVGRNDPCPCGSGSKFKKCHGLPT